MFSIRLSTFLTLSLIFFSSHLQAFPGYYHEGIKLSIHLEDSESIDKFLEAASYDEMEAFLRKSLTTQDSYDSFERFLAPRRLRNREAKMAQDNLRKVARKAFEKATPQQVGHLANLFHVSNTRGKKTTFFYFNPPDLWAQIVFENLPTLAKRQMESKYLDPVRNGSFFFGKETHGYKLIKDTAFGRYGVLHLGQLLEDEVPVKRLGAFGDRQLVEAWLASPRSNDAIRKLIGNFVGAVDPEQQRARNWPQYHENMETLLGAAFQRAHSVTEWLKIAGLRREAFAHSEPAYKRAILKNLESFVRLSETPNKREKLQKVKVFQDDLKTLEDAYLEAHRQMSDKSFALLAKSCRNWP